MLISDIGAEFLGIRGETKCAGEPLSLRCSNELALKREADAKETLGVRDI